MDTANLELLIGTAQIDGTREYQEDDYDTSLLSKPDGTHEVVLVLSDGMGGHVGGAEASRVATAAVIEQYDGSSGHDAQALPASISDANQALADAIDENEGLDGMGCTLVVTSIGEDGLRWASVGDSPMWVYRHNDLIRLNADHSMVPVLNDLVASGRMTEQEAMSDGRRNSLRSALSGDEITLIDAPSDPYPIYEDDILILASDGIETLSPQEIAAAVARETEDMAALASELVALVEDKKRPSQDNTTVITARLFELQAIGSKGSKGSRAASRAPVAAPQEEATRTVRRKDVPPVRKKSGTILLLLLLLALAAGGVAAYYMSNKTKEPSPKHVIDEPDNPSTPNSELENGPDKSSNVPRSQVPASGQPTPARPNPKPETQTTPESQAEPEPETSPPSVAPEGNEQSEQAALVDAKNDWTFTVKPNADSKPGSIIEFDFGATTTARVIHKCDLMQKAEASKSSDISITKVDEVTGNSVLIVSCIAIPPEQDSPYLLYIIDPNSAVTQLIGSEKKPVWTLLTDTWTIEVKYDQNVEGVMVKRTMVWPVK